jgi:hypothetical protein
VNLTQAPSEGQLRWLLDQMIRAGQITPDQASWYLATMMGLTPHPGNLSYVEHATDTSSDIMAGNVVVLTTNSPKGALMFPQGQRASGNQVLNVTFDLNRVEYNRAMPSTVYKCAVVGHAKFGAGGGGHSVDFDVKDGVQISLVGQGPQISVELEQPGDPASPTTVVVAASIGVGSRASRAFNTRTLPPTAVAPSLSLFAKTPKFAYSFLPFCDDPAALDPGATSIQFWGYAGDCDYKTGGLYGAPTPPVLVTGELLATLSGSDFGAARLTEGLKLPQGASLVTITNNLPTPVTWTPCFALSI